MFSWRYDISKRKPLSRKLKESQTNIVLQNELGELTKDSQAIAEKLQLPQWLIKELIDSQVILTSGDWGDSDILILDIITSLFYDTKFIKSAIGKIKISRRMPILFPENNDTNTTYIERLVNEKMQKEEKVIKKEIILKFRATRPKTQISDKQLIKTIESAVRRSRRLNNAEKNRG